MNRCGAVGSISPWAVAGLLMAVCAFAGAAWVAFGGALHVAPLSCPSPPSQASLREQQEFVRLHLPDASDFELGHRDCDDSNAGYVEFTTKLAPAAARKAFLADDQCAAHAEEGDVGVKCTSGRFDVYLWFDPAQAGSTGTLDISDVRR